MSDYSVNGYDTAPAGGSESVPRHSLLSATPGPSLVTQWIVIDGVAVPFPFSILGDSRREMIGFYKPAISGTVSVFPINAPPGTRIDITAANPNFEMRLSSHGPVVQDGFSIESVSGDPMVILIVTSEG